MFITNKLKPYYFLQPTDPPDPQRQLQGPDQTPDQAARVGGRHLARGRHPEGDAGRPPGLHGQRQGQGQGEKVGPGPGTPGHGPRGEQAAEGSKLGLAQRGQSLQVRTDLLLSELAQTQRRPRGDG